VSEGEQYTYWRGVPRFCEYIKAPAYFLLHRNGSDDHSQSAERIFMQISVRGRTARTVHRYLGTCFRRDTRQALAAAVGGIGLSWIDGWGVLFHRLLAPTSTLQ